ncbi:hypothetical protein HK102_013391 [Quaeritorhiza haematococci]|nr:hypothetical protein HK102_013391 [Quaeritorhiza haematococci]
MRRQSRTVRLFFSFLSLIMVLVHALVVRADETEADGEIVAANPEPTMPFLTCDASEECQYPCHGLVYLNPRDINGAPTEVYVRDPMPFLIKTFPEIEVVKITEVNMVETVEGSLLQSFDQLVGQPLLENTIQAFDLTLNETVFTYPVYNVFLDMVAETADGFRCFYFGEMNVIRDAPAPQPIATQPLRKRRLVERSCPSA